MSAGPIFGVPKSASDAMSKAVAEAIAVCSGYAVTYGPAETTPEATYGEAVGLILQTALIDRPDGVLLGDIMEFVGASAAGLFKPEGYVIALPTVIEAFTRGLLKAANAHLAGDVLPAKPEN